MPRPLVALAIGDPAGPGPEACLRAVSRGEVRRACRTVLVGDRWLLEETARRTGISWAGVEVWDLPNLYTGEYRPGRPDDATAAAALEYLEAALEMARRGAADAACAAPLGSREDQGRLVAGWLGPSATVREQSAEPGIDVLALGPGLPVLCAVAREPEAVAGALMLAARLASERARAESTNRSG